MTFAIFYNHEDLTPIAANLSSVNLRQYLTQAEVSLANKIWNGGLRNWSSAPVTMDDPVNAWRADNDPDCRTCVINAPNVNLSDMVALVRTVGNAVPGATYLLSIARDLEGTGVDPWE